MLRAWKANEHLNGQWGGWTSFSVHVHNIKSHAAFTIGELSCMMESPGSNFQEGGKSRKSCLKLKILGCRPRQGKSSTPSRSSVTCFGKTVRSPALPLECFLITIWMASFWDNNPADTAHIIWKFDRAWKKTTLWFGVWYISPHLALPAPLRWSAEALPSFWSLEYYTSNQMSSSRAVKKENLSELNTLTTDSWSLADANTTSPMRVRLARLPKFPYKSQVWRASFGQSSPRQVDS